MSNSPHYWHARTPRRVELMGLLLLLMVIVSLGVVWLHWGLAFWYYAVLSVCVCILTINSWWRRRHKSPQVLCFDTVQGFGVLSSGTKSFLPVRIIRLWQNELVTCVELVTSSNQKKQQLIFWRGAQSAQSWRTLQLYLLRYQLLYQMADPKGAL